MKKSKKLVAVALTCLVVASFGLFGCSSSGDGEASSGASAQSADAGESADAGKSAKEEKKPEAKPTLGSTIEFDDLSITFGTELSTAVLENQFSDLNGSTVVSVPVSITNHKEETHSLNMFYVEEFGSQGTELDTCYTYFDDIRMAGEMRPDATMEGALYFLYDGDGTYYISFDNFKEKVEVEIPVAL